jgi:N-acetylneuraminic acid mutarotase
MKKIQIALFYICFLSVSMAQTENYWLPKADFGGLKRERTVAFSINDMGYVGTGVDTAEVVHNDFWSYHPATDSWTQVADLPSTPRRNAIAFSVNNIGYVGTGMDSITASNGGNTLADMWAYDPVTNTWTQKADYPGNGGQGVYFATAFSVNNKGYVCCGKVGSANYISEFWEYKPLTDSWIQRQSFPGGIRYQLCSFAVNGKGYVGLGVDLDVYRKDFYEFDPLTNQWTQKNDFLGSERAAVCTFTLGERGFICLGNDGGYKKDLWEYNPYEDSWSIRADFPASARKNAVAFSIGNVGYVGTGKAVSGKKQSFYAYIPYQSALGAVDVPNDFYVHVYPNPVVDYISINTSHNLGHDVLIYNLNGELILNQILSENCTVINRQNIPNGTYIIVVANDENKFIYSKKICLI